MPEIIEKISKEELEILVKEIIENFVRQNEQKARELSIIERVIRVEEEIKALREIENARFESTEKRFEAIDKRFDAIEKRFQFLQWFMGVGFTFISILIAIFGLIRH
ncbi:hypothetical protein [Thermodesulfovibrio sp. TK110]